MLIAEENDDYYVDISNAIEGVFLGVDFPKVYIHSLNKVLSENIDIFQLQLNDSIPSVLKVNRTSYNT